MDPQEFVDPPQAPSSTHEAEDRAAHSSRRKMAETDGMRMEMYGCRVCHRKVAD